MELDVRNNMRVMKSYRPVAYRDAYDVPAVLEKRGAQGEQCGMDSEFMKKIFEAIHEESVRQQMEIINK